MLKWTVVKRDAFHQRHEPSRRTSLGGCSSGTTTGPLDSGRKPKRRRSSTGRRRSSSGKQRNSLGIADLSKENRFTSTPIKDEVFPADAFRDVSNLTPKDSTHRQRRRSECKKTLYSPAKKKKPCIEPEHLSLSGDFLLNLDNTNYFKPFEAVDSHIEGSFLPNVLGGGPKDLVHDCRCHSKTPGSKRFAPTIPSYALDYSPPSMVCSTSLCPSKMDPVSDFLQRISMITSPSELQRHLPGYRPKPTVKVPTTSNPLVKHFQRKCSGSNPDDSSFINDLSLDKLVDAILDTSENAENENLENDSRASKVAKIPEREVNLSGTSSDSGFRSSTTETSTSTDTFSLAKFSAELPDSLTSSREEDERTMINLEGTYNERCVDVTQIGTTRKRPLSMKPSGACDPSLDSQFNGHLIGPTLKRQKCIRQKKIPKKCEIPPANDHSFDSDSTTLSGDEEDVRNEATYIVASPEVLRPPPQISTPVRNLPQGSIDLDVQYSSDAEEILVTVFGCQDLRRQNGLPINAYIKVALSDRTMDGRRKHRGTLQRTAVQPESAAPSFGHTFRVPLLLHSINDGHHHHQQAVLHSKALYVEVWHRDRNTRRSEFLGCTSFAIKDVLKKKIRGSFQLHAQWSETSNSIECQSATVETPIVATNINNNNHLEDDKKQDVGAEEGQKVEEVGFRMSEIHHTSIDELIADEATAGPAGKPSMAALSEQQKRADENLFLRYLELDPVDGPEAAPALAQRKASGNKTNGRTPFTMTKVVRRAAPKAGFGFSVVWTHPPRIERVERGLPADKAGVQPGDYLIFVDKHNVVMMPEVDILNLIRSLGNQLTLEIFRRDPNRNGSVPNVNKPPGVALGAAVRLSSLSGGGGLGGLGGSFETTGSTTGLPLVASSLTSVAAGVPPSTATPRRPSTVCSTNTASVEYSRKKLHLPQVTFTSERPTSSSEEARRKAMYQIIAKEQQYATSMQFAATRYVQSLLERKDLIGQPEHRTLFQNSEELLRISEEIIDHLIQVDGEYQTGSLVKLYATKLTEITTAYKRYCSGIKKADCVLANLMKNQEFSRFITTPAIPRRRPDLTSFIHKPLEHYREILKLFNVILTNTKTNQTDEYNIVNHIVHELQGNYREMTSQVGLMEPVGEGRPLLSVQDLETRLVFTKCKPFVLSKPGRQWIFGGDLSRVEGRTVRQYWALLFSDILLFAKVSRDRVLFILEEPLPLSNISDMFFNVRKKENEFRIVVEPGGTANRNTASSPTVHCGPDLSRTPRKNPQKRCIILRTPTVELKAVWQNLLQRQIFHINSVGGDGSAYSSPVESPDCQPMTSSVMTLQSAESLSRHQRLQHSTTSSGVGGGHHLQQHHLHHHQQQQGPNTTFTGNHNLHNNNNNNEDEARKMLDELIEHKCKQLEKSSISGKSNAIHLEQWMKGQFNHGLGNNNVEEEVPNDGDDELELWTEEQVRKRSEELRLVQPSGDGRIESRAEEVPQDEDQSPSRSTNTTESQVTVRSSPLVPESVSMCRKCQRTCYHPAPRPPNGLKLQSGDGDEEEDWRPLMLMGLSAVNPAASLVKLDPFAMPLPKIAVLPPTPTPESLAKDCNCNCTNPKVKSFDLALNKSYDNSPDDSPINETDEQPYHSLHSSNLTLRRFGTVSSLERVGSEEEAYDCTELSETNEVSGEDLEGIDNEGFNSTIMTWTAKAGSFVAAKMAFLEKLPDYLRTEMAVNGEEIQEEETSGATSGEEIWGTPTSGGELDDPLSSPQYEDQHSPNGSISSNEDTELMMDELLMIPPVTSANIRGLLPRRTLEPLMEEEFSDTCTTSTSSSPTPTEPSVSPEQGNETGDAADECSTAVGRRSPPSSGAEMAAVAAAVVAAGRISARSSNASGTRLGIASLRSTSTTPQPAPVPPPTSTSSTSTPQPPPSMIATVSVCPNRRPPPSLPSPHVDAHQEAAVAVAEAPDKRIFIKRTDSYQKIIEAEDDRVGFFTRFRNRPSMKYVNIERIPPNKGVKFLEFFNVRRERKIYETFPGGKHLIKVFSREGDDSENVPTSYAEKPEILQRIKQERQLDRRFWKQLSKRRNSNSPNRQTNSTGSAQSASPILHAKDNASSVGQSVNTPSKQVQPLTA